VTEGRGPEEFFEVFRSVQSNRKKRDEKPVSPGAPSEEKTEPEATCPRKSPTIPSDTLAPPAAVGAGPRARPVQEGGQAQGPAPTASQLWERELTVSLPVAALSVIGALLVVVAAYLLGRQHEWQTLTAAQAAKGAPANPGAAPSTATSAAALFSAEPEYNKDGRIFRMDCLGTGTKDRDRAEREARHLNSYKVFTDTLKAQAYVWRDKDRKYWLCARGLAALSPADFEKVRKEIRKLKSSSGRPDFDKADFYAP